MLQLKCKRYAKRIFCNKCTGKLMARWWIRRTRETWIVWPRFRRTPSYRGSWYISTGCSWIATITCSFSMERTLSGHTRYERKLIFLITPSPSSHSAGSHKLECEFICKKRDEHIVKKKCPFEPKILVPCISENLL